MNATTMIAMVISPAYSEQRQLIEPTPKCFPVLSILTATVGQYLRKYTKWIFTWLVPDNFSALTSQKKDKGIMSRKAYLEKKNVIFFKFVVCNPSLPAFLAYEYLLKDFKTKKNYYFDVFFNLKVILYIRKISKQSHVTAPLKGSDVV